MNSLQEQLQKLGFQQTETQLEDACDNTNTVVDTSQVVRLQRQTKGRKGKGVTVIFDLPQHPKLLADYASQLRKTCGVGGAVKDGTIELQGDQREKAKLWLEQHGFKVKLAGG